MPFECTTLVAADPETVWSVLADVRRWPEWTASMTSVEPATPGPVGQGSVVRVRQPKLPPATWTITEFVPGVEFTWVSTAPGVTTTAWHRLAAEGDRTRLTIGLSQGGPLGRLIGLLAGRLIRRYLAMEAEGLRAAAERR